MALLEDLKWRYATKKMNGKIVQQEKLDYILEAARLAPSSFGLQQYRIFIIKQGKKLEQINELVFKNFPFNQSQISTCSHLLVWAAFSKYTFDRIETPLRQTSIERGQPENYSDEYIKRLYVHLESFDKNWQENHCAKQAYLSFGIALLAAAEQKVDATPMEGFDKTKMDEFLGISNQSELKSVLAMPIGYRDEDNDWLVNLKKWRVPKSEFVTEII